MRLTRTFDSRLQIPYKRASVEGGGYPTTPGVTKKFQGDDETFRGKPPFMEIWKQQIVLFWDGIFTGHEHWIMTPSERAAPLPQRAERCLHQWRHLRGHARWSEAKEKFFLPLSVQNLWRVFHQFGKINVRAGQAHINELRRDYADFKQMCTLASSIKQAETPEPYEFKLPPLAIYQHKGVELSVKIPAVPLFFDCGLGKTYISLVSTEIQIKLGLVERGKVLIAGKLLTLSSGWMKDCEKFTDLKAELVWLPNKAPKKGEKTRRERMIDMIENSDADILITNHESIPLFAEHFAKRKFQRIIIDEATILKNFRGEKSRTGSLFGKHLMAISEHAKYRTVLTGTPAPNSPADLWGLFHWLDPKGFLLEPTFKDFQTEYMEEIVYGRADDPLAKRTWVVPERNFDKIAQLHSQLSYRARLRDHLKDLPELSVIPRKVVMGKKQAKHYDDMEKKLATEIEGEFISTDVALAQMNKMRQITGGFIIDQTSTAHTIEDGAKLLVADQLIFEEIAEDEKIIVACQYQWEVETLCERYKIYNPVSLYGGNSGAKNVENVDRFLNDSSVRICVLNPASAAHGITFTHCRYMIIYSMDFSAERDYQVVKRMERNGQKRAMFLYYLLAERPEAKKAQKPSVDVVMWGAVEKKHANQAQLIDENYQADLLSAWSKR